MQFVSMSHVTIRDRRKARNNEGISLGAYRNFTPTPFSYQILLTPFFPLQSRNSLLRSLFEKRLIILFHDIIVWRLADIRDMLRTKENHLPFAQP